MAKRPRVRAIERLGAERPVERPGAERLIEASAPNPGGKANPWAERCAEEIMESVPAVMRFIRREMRRRGAPGLSVPQLRTLVFLSLFPGADLSSVADHLGVARPTASVIVDRLARQGLVNRAARPRERSRLALTLTARGARRLRSVRASACARVACALADRPSAELRRMTEGAALLGRVFKEAFSRKDS